MHGGKPEFRLFITASLLVIPALAVAQADCSAELADFDRRIASGDYPETNVAMARQMRDSLQQMCGFLDDEQKAQFLAQLETLLPVQSDETQLAARRARSEEQKAIREERKLEEARRAAAEPTVPPGIKSPPTAKLVAARMIDRGEDMLRLSIADSDIFKGKARILYVTTPSRTQLGRPDWQVYVYVVEISADGSFAQYTVTSRQAQDNRAVALRRGYDEIVFERHVGDHSDNTTLERWSISGQKLLSSVTTPKPAWPNGDTWPWQPFRLATADGNVLFAANKKDRAGTSTLAWFEASPAGEVLGMGSIESGDADLGTGQFFPTENGGGGLVIDINARDDSGIRGSIVPEITDQELQVASFSERRALVTGDDPRSAWQSDVLGRTLLWSANGTVPATQPGGETIQQLQEQRRRQASVEHQLRANRTIASMDVGMGTVTMIRPMTDGYGILSVVTAERSLRPPIHGSYFQHVDENGVSDRTYLNPTAEELEVDFEILAVSPDDDVYVYGSPTGRADESYVVRLNAGGTLQAYARAAPHYEKAVVIQNMMADDSGVWLYGVQTPVGSYQRFWVERIEF